MSLQQSDTRDCVSVPSRQRCATVRNDPKTTILSASPARSSRARAKAPATSSKVRTRARGNARAQQRIAHRSARSRRAAPAIAATNQRSTRVRHRRDDARDVLVGEHAAHGDRLADGSPSRRALRRARAPRADCARRRARWSAGRAAPGSVRAARPSAAPRARPARSPARRSRRQVERRERGRPRWPADTRRAARETAGRSARRRGPQ